MITTGIRRPLLFLHIENLLQRHEIGTWEEIMSGGRLFNIGPGRCTQTVSVPDRTDLEELELGQHEFPGEIPRAADQQHEQEGRGDHLQRERAPLPKRMHALPFPP